jgi:hypothetical protein
MVEYNPVCLTWERGASKLQALPHENVKEEDLHLTEEERAWLAIVRRQVRSLRFGVVQIVVHNARVVQIERTEKLRLNEASRLEGEGSLRSMEGI